ncbi:MAG: site-2 protease family protein [Planctomycetota bacterium]
MHGWWVATFWSNSPALLISWIFWVILSITLHELAHGVAAIRQGDRTPIELGHMTWNPLVHMGPWSLAMFALLGLAWGAMPVNPSRFRSRYGDAIVAVAGPLTNLGLFVICALLNGLWAALAPSSVGADIQQNLQQFFFAGAVLNGVLFAFNLVPVPPLDGFRIISNFFPRFGSVFDDGKAQFVVIVLFALLWIRGFGWLFGGAAFVTLAIEAVIGAVIP